MAGSEHEAQQVVTLFREKMALDVRAVDAGAKFLKNLAGVEDPEKKRRIIGVTFRTRTPEESLACSERFSAHLLDAVAKGTLKPVLDRTFPFDRLADAHKYMLSDA